jgi:hypothetical protein
MQLLCYCSCNHQGAVYDIIENKDFGKLMTVNLHGLGGADKAGDTGVTVGIRLNQRK